MAYLDWVATVLAIIGGLFGGIPRIFDWFSRPNVRVTQCKINRYQGGPSPIFDDFGEIVGAEDEDPSVVVSWRILNALRYYIFGKSIVNTETTWNLERIDSSLEPFMGKLPVITLIALKQEIPQSVTLPVLFLSNGVYVLSILLMSEGKRICEFRKTIEVL